MTTGSTAPMVDIHCHMIPGIDDGSPDLQTSIEMAQMAVRDGIGTVIVTPHQLGSFGRNTGDRIRAATAAFNATLKQQKIPLNVLPGGDVRIEKGMRAKLQTGEVMSLADRRKSVLLELPHELYFPLEPVLQQLKSAGMQGILSHPERNQGILRHREVLPGLVDAGCLMQLTAGSIVGSMGPLCQQFSQWMLEQGLVHFVATDAHGIKARRPRLTPARRVVEERCGAKVAEELFVTNPTLVALGKTVPEGRRTIAKSSGGKRGWFGFGRVA